MAYAGRISSREYFWKSPKKSRSHDCNIYYLSWFGMAKLVSESWKVHPMDIHKCMFFKSFVWNSSKILGTDTRHPSLFPQKLTSSQHYLQFWFGLTIHTLTFQLYMYNDGVCSYPTSKFWPAFRHQRHEQLEFTMYLNETWWRIEPFFTRNRRYIRAWSTCTVPWESSESNAGPLLVSLANIPLDHGSLNPVSCCIVVLRHVQRHFSWNNSSRIKILT